MDTWGMSTPKLMSVKNIDLPYSTQESSWSGSYSLIIKKINIKYLLHIVLAGMALLCHSCQLFMHDNNGYPSSVRFPKEGGTLRISGTQAITYIEIDEKDGHLSSGLINDSNYISFKWLSTKWKEWDTEFILTAEPTTGKKSRQNFRSPRCSHILSHLQC